MKYKTITPSKETKLSIEDIINYLIAEFDDEQSRYLNGKSNHYSYISMICNDLGLIKIVEK